MSYAFADCELDLRRYEPRRGGTGAGSRRQVFDILVLLVREPIHTSLVPGRVEARGERQAEQSPIPEVVDLRAQVGEDGRRRVRQVVEDLD